MPKVWYYNVTPSEFVFMQAMLCYNNYTTSWF